MVDVTLLYLIGSTITISLIALIGIVVLFFNDEVLQKLFIPLIAFSAGTLLATSFIHLIPEAVHQAGNSIFIYVWLLIGFMSFFFAEQVFNWHMDRHNYTKDKQPEQNHDHRTPASYLILIADGLHNFVGGLAIGSSFLLSIEVGLITVIASAAHEIPQEFGDFGILVHGGWEKQKAFVANFTSALSIIPGALLAYYMGNTYSTPILLMFAAGNFIYIAASDLVPEITHGQSHHTGNGITSEKSIKETAFYLFLFIVGIVFIIAIRILLHGTKIP